MVINGFILYDYINIDPMHLRERWNYSGAHRRSSTISFTPIGSAGIQKNMKNPYTINDFIDAKLAKYE
jgi:hypothetical protein